MRNCEGAYFDVPEKRFHHNIQAHSPRGIHPKLLIGLSAGDFSRFAGVLEKSLKCWSLQQNAERTWQLCLCIRDCLLQYWFNIYCCVALVLLFEEVRHLQKFLWDNL